MEEVTKNRKEEVLFTNRRQLWSLAPITECWDKTGAGPTSCRWGDTNKLEDPNLDVRCRLVARDFKGKGNDRDDLFASTPRSKA